jgi:hypothetical protein
MEQLALSLDEVRALLESHGFVLNNVLEESRDMGTAFFRRVQEVPEAPC